MEEREEKIKKLLMNIKRIPNTESWNLFYTYSNCQVLCESYSDWPQFQHSINLALTSLPPSPSDVLLESSGAPASSVVILVPGCGNSRLSERLYDAGFTNITSVDFSSVVVAHMLSRNMRGRPLMNWRVMDLTNMQFANESFDAIVDIGGLDAVVEPNLGYDSGHIYLSEVKRLLKPAGKYICITLAESKVLGVLFPRFRCGWQMNCYGSTSGDFSQNLVMMVAWKLAGSAVSQIPLFFRKESLAHDFDQAIEEENKLRKACSGMFDPFIPLEDLKANLNELEPGRRLKFTLGQPGVSHSYYNCILLDAQQNAGPFSIPLLVFVVPNSRHLEWITTSSKEQWQYVEHFKAARLLMVVLSPKHGTVTSADMQKHIFPLVNAVVPGNCDEDQVVYAIANGGIRMKETVHQVTSDLSGLIVVDDLICDEDCRHHHHIPDKDPRVRCLTVANIVRSKALLTTEGPNASSGVLKVDHSDLNSTRHTAMISGLLLMSVHLKKPSSAQTLVKRMFIGCIPLFKMNAVVIGLGAGLLPMFMNQLPYFTTEVVEADPVMLDVAREYFDFIADECLKVHITDGIQFVNEKSNCNAEGPSSSKIDILILDVDSSNQKAVLASPPKGFVEKSFLSNVKNSLSEDGLFIINMVTRSAVGKSALYARLKEVFVNLFTLEIEEDVKNEVIFAFNSDSSIDEAHLSEACSALAKSLEVLKPKWSQSIIDASKSFKPLKE